MKCPSCGQSMLWAKDSVNGDHWFCSFCDDSIFPNGEHAP